jgi:hypothetical protein
MWRVAFDSAQRPYWHRAGDAATTWTPPVDRGTVHATAGVPVLRSSRAAVLESFGAFAARTGVAALTTKELEAEGWEEVVLARVRSAEASVLGAEWDNSVGGVVLAGAGAAGDGSVDVRGAGVAGDGRLEGEEVAEWRGIRFFRQPRPSDSEPTPQDSHLVVVSVFNFAASYRRPSHYAHGLLHLSDAVKVALPGFRLRVYFDRSLLPPAQRAAIVRAGGPGKTRRDVVVAREGEEAWAYTLRVLATQPHVDLVRFECPACLATPEGEHKDLFGCFMRLVPVFSGPGEEEGGVADKSIAWALGPRPGRVVYCSDADFKATPMELVGLQLAARLAAASDRGEEWVPELVGGAFGGSTAPRHWPYSGLPPIMAGQLMTTVRFPSHWLTEYLDDSLRGRLRSMLGGRYVRDLHDPRTRVDSSFDRRNVAGQRSCFAFGADEAFLTSHLVLHAMNRPTSRTWLFWDFPIAVARGVMKSIAKFAEEAERARRTPTSSASARRLMGALAVLAGGLEEEAGVGAGGGLYRVPASVDDWAAAVGKWWESPRLEWSEPAEKLPKEALGAEAAAVTTDFASALAAATDLLLSGAANHTTDDLLYLLQFRKMIAEGVAVGGIRSTAVRVGGGALAADASLDARWASGAWHAIAHEEVLPRVPRPHAPWVAGSGAGHKRPREDGGGEVAGKEHRRKI